MVIFEWLNLWNNTEHSAPGGAVCAPHHPLHVVQAAGEAVWHKAQQRMAPASGDVDKCSCECTDFCIGLLLGETQAFCMHLSEHNKSTTVLGAPFRLHNQVFVHWLSLGHNMTHPESFQTLRQHLNPHHGNGLPCSGLRTKGDLMQIICSSGFIWHFHTTTSLGAPRKMTPWPASAQTAALRQWLAVKRPIFPPLPAESDICTQCKSPQPMLLIDSAEMSPQRSWPNKTSVYKQSEPKGTNYIAERVKEHERTRKMFTSASAQRVQTETRMHSKLANSASVFSQSHCSATMALSVKSRSSRFELQHPLEFWSIIWHGRSYLCFVRSCCIREPATHVFAPCPSTWFNMWKGIIQEEVNFY